MPLKLLKKFGSWPVDGVVTMEAVPEVRQVEKEVCLEAWRAVNLAEDPSEGMAALADGLEEVNVELALETARIHLEKTREMAQEKVMAQKTILLAMAREMARETALAMALVMRFLVKGQLAELQQSRTCSQWDHSHSQW